jgi:3-oxoacyl-[acyl-carrier protein] reductase
METAELRGQVALITGGSRGIGAAIAQHLARDGADIAFTYEKSADAANVLVEKIEATGVRAAAYQADQADADAVTRMVDEVAERFGAIDILVNNAAVYRAGPMGSLSRAEFEHIWAVNVGGTVVATQEATRHMPDGGRVVTISSGAAQRASAGGFADYAATKAAVAAYGRSWAHELAPRDITVNTLVVGLVDTDMAVAPDSELGQAILAGVPLRRYAVPDEIAAMVSFLARPAASYLTGSEIRIDGGWNA